MQNLFRRPSGVYVFRLTVPVHLRRVIGKRKIVATTGTHELPVAKIVGASLASQWLQHFFESDRLLSVTNTSTMPHEDLLKIAHGHPALLTGSHLQLPHAAAAAGMTIPDLLRAAADGRLELFIRAVQLPGYLLPTDSLEPVDPVMGYIGGIVVPHHTQMPMDAMRHIGVGPMRIFPLEVPGLTSSLLAGIDSVEVGLFELPGHPGMMFTPDEAVPTRQSTLEVVGAAVEALRHSVLALVEPAHLKEAKLLHKASLRVTAAKAGKKAHALLSTALASYVANRVRQDVTNESEVMRIRNGCALLLELEGDLRLADVDSDRLRQFRDKHLARIPEGVDEATAELFPDSFEESALGLVPRGWRPIRLDAILELAYGRALKAEHRKHGPVPMYGSGGITGWHDEALVKGPSVVVGRKGTVGSLYWESRSFFAIDTVFYVKTAYPVIYCYLLLGTLGLSNMNTDAAVPGLNRENVYRLTVPQPPAEVVAAFDVVVGPLRGAIDHNSQQAQTLVSLRDALLPRLISGQLRLPAAQTELEVVT